MSLVTIDYVQVTPGNYDTATDVVTSVERVWSDVPGVTAKLTEAEMSGITPNRIAQKLLVAALRLPFKPKEVDYIWIAGARWEIKKIASPPGSALYVFSIQEP